MSIGAKIKELRIKNKLTLKDLSNKSGVGQSTISDIENEVAKNPKSDTITKLADALGVTTNYLLDIATTEKPPLSPEVETIAAHLEEKAENITPHKMKMLKRYIDDLFEDFD